MKKLITTILVILLAFVIIFLLGKQDLLKFSGTNENGDNKHQTSVKLAKNQVKWAWRTHFRDLIFNNLAMSWNGEQFAFSATSFLKNRENKESNPVEVIVVGKSDGDYLADWKTPKKARELQLSGDGQSVLVHLEDKGVFSITLPLDYLFVD